MHNRSIQRTLAHHHCIFPILNAGRCCCTGSPHEAETATAGEAGEAGEAVLAEGTRAAGHNPRSRCRVHNRTCILFGSGLTARGRGSQRCLRRCRCLPKHDSTLRGIRSSCTCSDTRSRRHSGTAAAPSAATAAAGLRVGRNPCSRCPRRSRRTLRRRHRRRTRRSHENRG